MKEISLLFSLGKKARLYYILSQKLSLFSDPTPKITLSPRKRMLFQPTMNLLVECFLQKTTE